VDPRLPAVTDIYDFTGTAVDGGYPDGGLLWVAGRLYGTAPLGGTTTCFQTYYGVPNCGEIFALTPPVNGQTHWSFAALHEFAGPPDGWQPNGHLLLYSGMIVGMTEIGGYYESGTAFAISPDGRNYQQFFSFPLVSFPFRGFIAVGTTLLGTTEEGGNGWGNVFKLTPQGRGRFAYASLYSFSFGSGGSYPLGTLLALTRGPSPGAVAPGGFDPLANVTLYGTTACCGGNNGTVFKLTPPRPATGPNAQWTATTEWDFTSGADGSNPQGSLVFWNGLLYGTTPTANNLNTGTVFSTTL
jgi:hypothetical protein